MAGFSASLQLTGLDYIAPSQACVLPLLPAEEVGSVMRHDKRAKGAESKVKLDLADCLACSGCVTTAETMLVQEQSLRKFWGVLRSVGRGVVVPAGVADAAGEDPLPAPETPPKKIVVSLSPQSVAAFAEYFKEPPAAVFARMDALFKQVLHCDEVIDLFWAQSVSLLESTGDTLQRLVDRHALQNEDRTISSPPPLPAVTSACPGVVCTVEKKGELPLGHLSSAPSAQAVAGKIVKQVLAEAAGIGEFEVFHVSVQPCYDKKLEATRREFGANDGADRYTDLVLATHEVLDLVASLAAAPPGEGGAKRPKAGGAEAEEEAAANGEEGAETGGRDAFSASGRSPLLRSVGAEGGAKRAKTGAEDKEEAANGEEGAQTGGDAAAAAAASASASASGGAPGEQQRGKGGAKRPKTSPPATADAESAANPPPPSGGDAEAAAAAAAGGGGTPEQRGTAAFFRALRPAAEPGCCGGTGACGAAPAAESGPVFDASGSYCTFAVAEVARVLYHASVTAADLQTGGRGVVGEVAPESSLPGHPGYHLTALSKTPLCRVGSEWELKVVQKRPNFDEFTLVVGGAVVFKAAVCNGSQHMTNLVRTTRAKRVPQYRAYDFIELMACPGGCTNGGGQIRSEQQLQAVTPATLGQRVKALHHEYVAEAAGAPAAQRPLGSMLTVRKIYDFIGGLPFSQKAVEYLHTSFNDCSPVAQQDQGAQPTLAQIDW
ncbi:Protein NAR1 [Diplonema papillatum]|nr:Protein NAR1 [Diplonema papillatum]